jgi:hypothetical protein
MNRTLEARLRARERRVEVGAHVYIIRRPKPAEMLTDMTRMDLVRRFVVGWTLTNADLQPGGTPDAEPFDADLFADWIDDNPDLWEPLADAFIDDWRAWVAAREAAVKN